MCKMDEGGNVRAIKCKNICLTCLKTTNNLYPMSFECKNEYFKFVENVKEDAEMMMCHICYWTFQRFLKFKQQCQAARTLLEDASRANSENINLNHRLTFCHNLKTTKAKVHFFQENHLNSQDIENLKEIWNNSEVNSKVNNSTVNEVNDDVMYDSTEFNDDEMPLVLLGSSTDRRKTKKRKESRRVLIPDRGIESGPITISSNGLIKQAKEPKEGFSSRMVQETEEYVVIKLTKDQVLKEMKMRSETEAYLQSPYKCEECVKGFNFQDVLRTHREKHKMENGAFQCDMCFQCCRSAVSLRGHVKSHTTRYKCKLCDVVRLSRQHLLEHHAITHTRQPVTYSCDTCQFKTNKRTVMQRHVKNHASTEPLACDKCGKLFKSIDSLRVHTIRHDKSSRLRCSMCDVSFVYHSLLRRHVARVHERREYYCVECDAQFNSSESLRLHFKKAKRHRDASTYEHVCTECDQRFFSLGSLSVHRTAAHNATKPHACALCRRLYSTRDALRAHAWRVHAHKQTPNAS